MKSISDTLTIFWKDLRLTLMDRGMLAVVFFLPLIIGSMISQGYTSISSKDKPGETGFNIKIFLVNEDSGYYSDQVVKIIEGMTILNIEKLPAADGRSQADQAIRDGKKTAAIIIPSGFSEKVDTYEGTEIVVLTNPNQSVWR